MANQVNSSTFKKNQSQKKKNPWIPLVVIVVLALLMVLLNYFMLDVPMRYIRHSRKPYRQNQLRQSKATVNKSKQKGEISKIRNFSLIFYAIFLCGNCCSCLSGKT